MTTPHEDENLPKEINGLGLSLKKIELHQKRIQNTIRGETVSSLQVEAGCQESDQTVVSWKQTEKFVSLPDLLHKSEQWLKRKCVHMTPAAGAASRYFAELIRFVLDCEDLFLNPSQVVATLGKIERKWEKHFAQFEALYLYMQSTKWFSAFPDKTSAFFIEFELTQSQKNLVKLFSAFKNMVEDFGDTSKALIPATREGDTYLDLRIKEQEKLLPCLGNVVICPAGKKEVFKQALQRKASDWVVEEQGNQFSTLRFKLDGKPFRDSQGKLSIVSGGHGELLNLVPAILEKFPQAECLHLRNVDNIIGTAEEQKDALLSLVTLFCEKRSWLEQLRQSSHSAFSTKTLLELNQTFGVPVEPEAVEKLSDDEVRERIKNFLRKPLSVFGVVKKQADDVGGGPAIVKFSKNTTESIKLCLEMSHVEESQREHAFGKNGCVSFFNPVIVFLELQVSDVDEPGRIKPVCFESFFDEQFWLLVHRQFQGMPVCYHETVLYELIGNSAHTNLVFAEIPRSLFNPHKTVFDNVNGSRQRYKF